MSSFIVLNLDSIATWPTNEIEKAITALEAAIQLDPYKVPLDNIDIVYEELLIKLEKELEQR